LAMPLACLVPSLGVGGGRSSGREGYIKCPNPPQHPRISRAGREGQEPLSDRAPLSEQDSNKENWQLHHNQHFPGACSFNVHVSTKEDSTNTEMETNRVRKFHYQQNGNIFRTHTMSPSQLEKIPSLPPPACRVYQETKETPEKGRLSYCDSSITSPSSTAASTLSTSPSSPLDISHANYSVPIYDHHRVNDNTVSPTHVSVHKSPKSKTKDSSSGRHFYDDCAASLTSSRVKNISNGTSKYRNDNAGFRRACVAAITSRSAGHQQQPQSQPGQASVAKQHASTKADMSFPILSTKSRSRENDGTDGKTVNRKTSQQHNVSKSRTPHVSQCSFEPSSNATAVVRRRLSTNDMPDKKALSTTTTCRRFNEPSPSSQPTFSTRGLAAFDEEEFSIPEFPSSHQSTKQRNRSRNDKMKKTSDELKKNLGTERMSNEKKKIVKTGMSHRNIPSGYEAYLEAREAYECGRNFDPIPINKSSSGKMSVPSKSTAVSMVESPSQLTCLQFTPSRQSSVALQSPRLHVFDAVDFSAPRSGRRKR